MSIQDLVHQTLGQYRIDAPLDAGGMGQVFRGTHIYLGRPAAIKVMRPHLAADQKFRERFLQEARSAAALKHPNILDIYEFGEQDGCLYLVMELMTGGSLRSLLQHSRDQARPLALGLDLVRQAAEGLAAAHTAHVIHRDIKPDNLLLNPVSNPPHTYAAYQLKISDFGLARLAEGHGLTGTGGMMGTLAYMSPEQCQNAHLDGRSDLYSLGVVLYEVITGYRPFKVESIADAFEKHLKLEPVAPSKIRPDLPPVLDEIVLHCLAKRPEERYQSGTALARVLQQVIEDLDRNKLTTSMSMPFVSEDSEDKEGKPTVLQSQVSGTVTPPLVNSLPGSTTAQGLQIRVLDQQGQILQICPLVVAGQQLVIGRQADSDLILEGEQISRQHVQVKWDGARVLVTDLGSGNGSRLDGKRLVPQEETLWQEKKLLRIGRYWLRLEGRSEISVVKTFQPAGERMILANTMLTASPRTAIISSVGASERIGISIEPKMLTLTTEQTATVRVKLTNTGPLVDWFTVSVEDVPDEWITLPETGVQLNPGMQAEVEIIVRVPRSSKYRAQEYKALIRATSREDANESAIARSRWMLQPFMQDNLDLKPRRASGRGRARYHLLLNNESNIPAQYTLRGDDDEQRIHYQFEPDHIELEPGTERDIPLQVQLKKHWLGRPQRYPFQIHAHSAGSRSHIVTSRGEFINQPIIPAWLLSAVGIMLVGGLIAASFLGLLPFPGKAASIATPTTVAQRGPTATSSLKSNTTLLTTPTATTHTPTPTPTLAPTASNNTNKSASGTSSGNVVHTPLAQKWTFPAAGALGSPTVTNGILYFGADEDHVYAVDASTGQQKWAFAHYDAIGSPTVANGILYFGSCDTNLYALDATTGQQKWTFPTNGCVGDPTVANGVIYVGSDDHNLYALDATTGQQKWAATTNGIVGLPTVSGSIVYFSSIDHNVYALGTNTGQQQWVFPTNGALGSPSVASGVLYVSSADHNLYALDAATGQQKWAFPTNGIVGSPTVGNGVLYVGSDDHNVYAIDTNTGQQKWTFATGSYLNPSSTLVNGVLYIGSADNNLYALDATTGQKKWAFLTNGIEGAPTVANGMLYFSAVDEKIFALTLPT